jgi:hypothetical protein
MTSQGPQDGLSSRSAREDLVRVFHESRWHERAMLVASLVHEQAEMRLLATGGEVVRGRAEISRVLSEGRPAEVFEAHVTGLEWLDPNTVLVFGRARFALEGGGFGDNQVVWLDRFRDGMLWRVDVFFDEQQARRRHETCAERPC